MNVDKLKKKALKLRQQTFHECVLKGEAHLGGSFSMIEILIYIYDIFKKKNDKFILSKAHASFPLCILLKSKGYNPKITTHLEVDEKNGINCTTGSLGHGLPISVGMAFARKKTNRKAKIICLISDGECQEGTTWESLLIASKHQLDNLIILIDYNKIQALSKLEDALPLKSLKKIASFNCNCININDGHSYNSIHKAFKNLKFNKKPNVMILNTIKSKGIKEFENDPVWHARKISASDIDIAKKD